MKNDSTQSTVYQLITDEIIKRLEAGVVPWQKPWSDHGPQRNFVSGKPYRGVNAFLLACTDHQSPFWASFKQIQDKGGRVRKGEKSTPVIFWKWLEVTTSDGETKKIPLARYYRVFNLDQTDGIDYQLPETTTREFAPLAACENIVAGMPTAPAVEFKEQQAFYAPSRDVVNMPSPETFCGAEEYYSTLFHELVHATGHRKRLNRDAVSSGSALFASHAYSKEELVAEMGAAMLCGVAGIHPATIDNSAAYIGGWLSKLRQDNKLVVQAAGQAQKAVDHIQGITFEETR